MCRFIFSICFVINFFWGDSSAEVKKNSEVRVMSFNIRLGVANDGKNRWDLRKNLVVDTIKKFQPDLLGLQEVFPMQEEFLRKNLPEYLYYGRSRLVEPRDGEACSVMIKRDRFKILRSSTFWLSEEENEPGSKSWDSSLPRIVNVVRLKDKLATRNELVFFNTHFDHKGKIAREESAKIIKARVGQLGNDERVIICGDFNSPEGSKPYNTLVDTGGMIDTFRIAKPNRTKEESTLTGWNGRLVGNRIDWVLCSTNFHVLSAKIDRNHLDGRYPSDHYPVTAVLKY